MNKHSPRLIFILLFIPILFLSAQTSGSLNDLTVDAILQREMLEKSGFFDDNYQRFFKRKVDSVTGSLAGFSSSFELGANAEDTIPSLNGGILVKDLGPEEFKLNLSFSSSFVNISNFLIPHETITWVDENYYINDYISYDMEASIRLFGILKFGFSSSGHTEFYKEEAEKLPYSEALQAGDYQKYILNLNHLDRIFRKKGTFNRLTDRLQFFLNNFGLDSSVLVEDFSAPKLLNNTVYTGIPLVPLISTLWLPDQELFLLDNTVRIPLGVLTLFLETGFIPLESTVYKAVLRMDLMGLIYKLLDGEEMLQNRNTLFEAGEDEVGMVFALGPEVSYRDYSFFKDQVFPYDRNYYMYDEGLNFGYSAGAYAVNPNLVIGAQVRMMIFGSPYFPHPGEFSGHNLHSSFMFSIYFR